MGDDEWHKVGPGTPCGVFLQTKREGEPGTNFSMCRVVHLGDEPEWIEQDRRSDITDELVLGRTTVTHHTFLPPTHWRWPKNH